MTPNKLPPLPETIASEMRMVLANPMRTKEILESYIHDWQIAISAEALRQSQSLPAGAVAYQIEHRAGRYTYCEAKHFEGNRNLYEGAVITPLYTALQADAREKGEAVDVAAEVAAFERHTRPQLYGAEAFVRIDGRPSNRFGLTWEYNGDSLQSAWGAWMARATLATQPAQASEKDNG